MAPAATITAQAGSRNARITAPRYTGKGASQLRAARLAKTTADHKSKSAPMVPNIAITTMAASAVVPIGIMTRIGIEARDTILGCAHANIWRIGQAPSARSEGRTPPARLTLWCGTYLEPGGRITGFGCGTR